MKQYIKYLKFKIIVTCILASLVSIVLFVKFLNFENTLASSLLVIGSFIIIGYTYSRYNYYRKINKLDKEVLESLK